MRFQNTRNDRVFLDLQYASWEWKKSFWSYSFQCVDLEHPLFLNWNSFSILNVKNYLILWSVYKNCARCGEIGGVKADKNLMDAHQQKLKGLWGH